MVTNTNVQSTGYLGNCLGTLSRIFPLAKTNIFYNMNLVIKYVAARLCVSDFKIQFRSSKQFHYTKKCYTSANGVNTILGKKLKLKPIPTFQNASFRTLGNKFHTNNGLFKIQILTKISMQFSTYLRA